MMQDKFEAMIFAYSLGCLNNSDKREFQEYILTGESFNHSELGEIQNLAALIPCSLEIEEVNPAVKDIVARRLYGLRNDIKKIRAQYKPENESSVIQQEESISNQLGSIAPPPVIEKTEDPELQGYVEFRPRRTAEIKRPPQETQINARTGSSRYTPVTEQTERNEPVSSGFMSGNLDDHMITQKPGNISQEIELTEEPYTPPIPAAATAQPKKTNYTLVLISFLLFFVVVIGIIYIYFQITSEVQKTKSEVDVLRGKVSSLTMQLSSNQEIQQMLQSPNISIVNLKGNENNASGYGKLIISPESGKGYIQLAQMPALPENNVYMLWMESSGKYTPLGSFTPVETIGYYSFNVLGLQREMEINFIVTQEESSAQTNPGPKVFLMGSL